MTHPEADDGDEWSPWFVNPNGQPDISATALLPDRVAMDYSTTEDGSAGVVLLGLADRQLRLIGTEDTFRDLATTVAELLTALGRRTEEG